MMSSDRASLLLFKIDRRGRTAGLYCWLERVGRT